MNEERYVIYIHRVETAYPKPNHAKSALAVLVTATLYLSIIGKVPEAIIDIKKERNELN